MLGLVRLVRFRKTSLNRVADVPKIYCDSKSVFLLYFSFTKAELTECLRLRDKYGHKWQYIGDRLKRSSECVRHLLEGYKSGVRELTFPY